MTIPMSKLGTSMSIWRTCLSVWGISYVSVSGATSVPHFVYLENNHHANIKVKKVNMCVSLGNNYVGFGNNIVRRRRRRFRIWNLEFGIWISEIRIKSFKVGIENWEF
jgi:hypothetical protein